MLKKKKASRVCNDFVVVTSHPHLPILCLSLVAGESSFMLQTSSVRIRVNRDTLYEDSATQLTKLGKPGFFVSCNYEYRAHFLSGSVSCDFF